MSVKKMIRNLMSTITIGDESNPDPEYILENIQHVLERYDDLDQNDPDHAQFIPRITKAFLRAGALDEIAWEIRVAFDEYYKKYPVEYRVYLVGEHGKQTDPHAWPGRFRIHSPPKFRIEVLEDGEVTESRYLTCFLNEGGKVYYSHHMMGDETLGTIDFQQAVLGCDDYKIVRARYLRARSVKKMAKKARKGVI